MVLKFFVLLQYGLLLPFHFLLCSFGSSLFFLVCLARGSLILFTLSKNQLLVSLIFVVLKSLLISSLSFIISFLLLTLSFVCSPLSNFFFFLGNRLGCLFEIFLIFLRKACNAMNFSSRTAFAASHRFCMVGFHCPLFQVFVCFVLFIVFFVCLFCFVF